MATDPKNPLDEEKTDVDDSVTASFNKLIDAAVRRWPSRYLYVIFNIMKFRDDDTSILYCFVRIPPELKEAILQIARENKKNPKDPKARAKFIFKKLAAIFTRLAEME